MAAANMDTSAGLVAVTGVVLLVPLLMRGAQGRFDLLEPIVWLNVALGLMFVARPAADLFYDKPLWRGVYDVTPTFNSTMIVVLFGIAGLYVGYSLPVGGRLARRTRPLPDALDRRSTIAWAWGLIIGVLLLSYVAFGRNTAMTPVSLFEGISGAGGGDGAGAYLYLAPLVIVPAALLMIRAGLEARNGIYVFLGCAFGLLLVNALAPSGQRLWLMALVLAFAIYPMLRSNWRPSPILVIICAIPLLFLAVALGDREPGEGYDQLASRTISTLDHPEETWKTFILQGDTEMFDALAAELQVVPDRFPYEPWTSGESVLTAPIPRSIWPDKPRQFEDRLNAFFYGGKGYREGAAGAAYSVLGGFYRDGWYFAVLIEMLLIGLIWRFLYEYLKANPENDMIRLLYAASLPFAVVLMRGNPDDTLARMLFIVTPIVVVAYVARRRQWSRSMPQTTRRIRRTVAS